MLFQPGQRATVVNAYDRDRIQHSDLDRVTVAIAWAGGTTA
jgi:hypothetical protein